MVTGASTIRRLIDVWDGEVVAPTVIEGVISELEAENADLMVERLAAAAQADLGDVPRALTTSPRFAADETLHLARRLGWTVKTLADWDPHHERSGLRIEAALASAAAWNWHGGFWEAARPRLQGCRLTIAALEIVLRRRAPQTQVPENAPLWEREHLQAMQEAERTQDWTELRERAQAFKQLPLPDLGAGQATLALSFLDWPRLVRLADKSEGWLHGHLLMAPLPLADALRLAAASRNGYARFAALERIAYREVRPLLPQEEVALRNLLIVLAKDANEWPRWLTVCNRYPIRHPHMQAAFGLALARSDEPALQAYIDSISLSTSDTDIRENVTHCLSVFRARAGTGRRRALWRAAFERWEAWDFAKNQEQNLTSLSRSALDYGVVGWLVESQPQKSLADLEQTFVDDLRTLDMQWHASLSSAVSGFVRLVSRYQVLSHAIRRSAGDADWLPGPAVELPAAATDEFLQKKYRWSDRQIST
ncbi:hypothetical protein [Aurantimonas sp. Leaf443]|uniref:hypothetical protein n=1 Tax=Aurantimonas sp. Leaf443 TaxID=1736378 RepID=UPI0012E3EDE5|nr:hypothetical protein [Aurantimonas sp. Leaf443]